MANIAIFRINYKSDFILTLNSDAGWMTPFCIKFWTGAPSQAYFVGYDGTTYTHCAPVDGEPTKLLVQFDDHHLPIGDLKFQIGYHFTVADFPNDVEDEVLNQASVIIEQDGEPAQVMLDFNGETAPEIEFSLPAYANEAQRIANEQQRIAAETQRIANEETRIDNEQTRINQEQTRQQNEQQRINQEQARVNEYARLKADAVAATGAANDAAALANQKAQLAADKAALAQAAADLANAKAQLATDKAALAASAAQLANDKATLAQQKAEYAQTQGGYAKDQGDYAKDQGDYAKAQGDYAKDQGDYAKAKGDYAKDQGDYAKEQGDYAKAKGDICAADHQTAVADHQTATADHQTAAADHQTATADHNQAGNDHTRAESDHTRAESDHDAVELYVDSLGVFDLSKHNAVGGVLATYADLSAALTALNALESKYKYGGMSFKFVHTSDNKYVQFRYISSSTAVADFTNVANWQGVDSELTAESKNLAESGAAFKLCGYQIVIDTADSSGYCKIVSGNLVFKRVLIRKNRNVNFTWLTDGTHNFTAEQSIPFDVGKFLYVLESEITPGGQVVLHSDVIANVPSNSLILGFTHSSAISSSSGGAYILNDLIKKDADFVGYKYMGVIHPTDATPILSMNDRVFYTAFESGNYTSFNYTVQRNTIVAFYWNGTSWNHTNIKGYSSDSYSYALFLGNGNNGYCKIDNGVLKFKYLLIKSNISNDTAWLTDGVHTYSEESQITLSGNKIFYILVSDILGKSLNQTVQLKIDTVSNATNDGTYIYLGITSSAGRNASGGLLDEIIRQNDINNLIALESETKKIPLNFGLAVMSKSSGNFTATSGVDVGLSASIGKYIKIPNDKKFIINTKNDFTGYIGLAFIFYDTNYNRINDSGWISVAKDTDYDVSSLIPANAEFFKICIFKSASGPKMSIPEIQMYAEGYFEENPYRYNIRPADDGYQTLEIPVDVADVSSDDAETATLQDNMNMMWDYGLLALPTTYKNTGKPTRLIIYCHGAGVHYTPKTTRFPEGVANFGVEPEYWLNEGYAVMDIEGDPFDNTNKHFYIPQALQCYIAAYKWVTENYNIAKDGVFLGGRSMGGSMCLDIIYNGIIPVIACCPVAGGFNPIAMWNAMGGASYRQFVATHMGMPNASSVAWTNNNPMSSTEYNYLKTNFKQLLQFTPVWRMIEMVPDQSVLMKDEFNVAYSAASVPSEEAVYSELHLKCRVPVKFFVSPEDTSAVANRSSKYVEMMMRNSGSICEYRILPTGGHSFELENQNRVASYTTRLGITMENVPIVYIEALQFWRRYELQH